MKRSPRLRLEQLEDRITPIGPVPYGPYPVPPPPPDQVVVVPPPAPTDQMIILYYAQMQTAFTSPPPAPLPTSGGDGLGGGLGGVPSGI
jgi:hypothetical protein